MDIIELKKQIMSNKLSNVYIFVGTEIEIQNIYLRQMSKVLNLPIVRADSVMSIHSQCTTKSLFGNTTAMYVIREDKDIMQHESVYQELSNEINDNVIILQYEKIDSRLKFGKFFKDRTVVFEPLAPSILANYIYKMCPLSEKFIAELSNEISGSYDMAILECDKINQYAQGMQIDVDSSFDRLMDSGVIYQPVESDVFQFTDAVCRRSKNAVYIANNLKVQNVSSINILGTLYNTMKNVLLVQCCEDSDISGITGLDNKQIYFAKKYVGKYSTERLVYSVKLLIDVIDGIKVGKIEDKYATMYVLCNIM